MTKSDPNLYLRDGISLVNLLRLLCPMHSFVLLLHTVCLDSGKLATLGAGNMDWRYSKQTKTSQ